MHGKLMRVWEFRTFRFVPLHNGHHCIAAAEQLLVQGSSLAELQPLAHT